MRSKLFACVQSFLLEAGEAACYGLCIVKLAERMTGRVFDPLDALLAGIDGGYIHYTWNNPNDADNFFVYDPEGFLGCLTGRAVQVRKVDAGEYIPLPEDVWIVERWERRVTGKTIAHFRLPDWDPLADSLTVKYGRLASFRVFKGK